MCVCVCLWQEEWMGPTLVLQEEIFVGETLEELREDALHDFSNGHMNRRLQFTPNIRPVLVQELIQIGSQRLVAIEQVRQLYVHSAGHETWSYDKYRSQTGDNYRLRD